jgi:CO dehydrogenase/acetyl-CoA synthase beta subunit
MMGGMRLVWIDELSKKKITNEIMKELGDGMKTENEVMFGQATF